MAINTVSQRVNICSNALLLLAHPPISSLDEIGAGPQLCRLLWDTTYKAFLATSNWNFATKTQQLSMMVDKPTNKDYQYQYKLPSDMIRVNSTNPEDNYIIEGSKLLSNSKNLFLEYQAYIDEIELSPPATEALEYLLATKLAYPLTNDGKKTELYANLYTKALQTAKYVDSQNDPNSGFYDNTLVDVRY